ncbi:LIN37 domain-containing protein [Ditylenchus destructor]|uniref:LIN37 domain-containing protein n=1 Tax=Ditylenchus destructor TaxID=166010 RepID=A0AAD4N5X1_9BILA|nr:LIN37 domain-containing protein [Ditylenchus destructor]
MASGSEKDRFVVPVSPSKRAYQQYAETPESPDMKHARYRLGNLLSDIRKGDIVIDAPRDEQTEPIFDEETQVKRGPGRPKKLKREKRVVFELRGKPFGLRDSGYPESIYALCRKWMYGKDDEPEPEKEEEAPYNIPRFQSLDLMATKEIYSLPAPREEIPLMDPRPQKVLRPEPISVTKTGNIDEMLEDYRKHWKDVKKNWSLYNRKREQRYSNSIQLLRTVYGIAQNSQ